MSAPPSSAAVALARAITVAWVAVAAGALPGCQRPEPDAAGPPLSAAALLGGGDVAGFQRALAPMSLEFPRDHGPHPGFRSEWWYFTGVLQTPAGTTPRRRFGYQFTIFRQALGPAPAPRASGWATGNIYMGHLAISDLDGDPKRPRFHAYQRFARDGLGLAGARATPFEVWVDDWRVAGRPEGAETFPLTLHARAATGDHPGTVADSAADVPRASLDLVVSAGRGPVLQGDQGLSQKGPGPGNASYYHSFTRLPTAGTVTLAGQSFTVSGATWLDREWSTSALDAAVVGWDWMGVQLADGRDVMVYKLRTAEGTAAPESRATLIDPDGHTRLFAPPAFTLAPTGQWQSADGRARYPAGLRLQIPAAQVDLGITPLLADQELTLAVRYWEGAVAVTGAASGRAVSGNGYLELTGYATSAPGSDSSPAAR